jgi:hypothetical protein
MSKFSNVAFDPETLAILKGVFDEAWVSYPSPAERQYHARRSRGAHSKSRS